MASGSLPPRPVLFHVPLQGFDNVDSDQQVVNKELSWREAGPPNHLDEMDSDQEVAKRELSLQGSWKSAGR